MCTLFGLSGWFILAVAFVGGALTIPALKMAWAKVKELWQQHVH